nr:hypothetical protein Iba_chr09aCG12060 [Ipomoea batatas]
MSAILEEISSKSEQLRSATLSVEPLCAPKFSKMKCCLDQDVPSCTLHMRKSLDWKKRYIYQTVDLVTSKVVQFPTFQQVVCLKLSEYMTNLDWFNNLVVLGLGLKARGGSGLPPYGPLQSRAIKRDSGGILGLSSLGHLVSGCGFSLDNFLDDTDEELEGVVEISSSDSEASTAHIEARHAAFRARHKDKATTAEKGKGKAVDMTPSDRTLVARLPSVFQARLNNAIKGLAKDSELLKFVKAAHSKEVKNLKADTAKLSTKLAEALEGFMRVTETQKSAWEDALREF